MCIIKLADIATSIVTDRGFSVIVWSFPFYLEESCFLISYSLRLTPIFSEVFDDDICTGVFLIFVIYFYFMILEFTLFHRADNNR